MILLLKIIFWTVGVVFALAALIGLAVLIWLSIQSAQGKNPFL